MKIVIVRHGPPAMSPVGMLKARELYKWIESYNAAGIDQKKLPPAKAIAAAAGCKAVVCSDLPRSKESAKVLSRRVIHCSASLFREMDLPYAGWNSLRLPPILWAALFRALWFLGYDSNSESLGRSRLRAEAGAQKLIEIAAAEGSVLFVGHGLINRFIAKELLRRGWKGPKSPGMRHWAFGIYRHGSR